MKKLIFSMLFVALVIIFSNESISIPSCNCPGGTSYGYINITYPGTDCYVHIGFCLDTLPSGHLKVDLCYVAFYGSINECNFTLDSDFWNWVNEKILEVLEMRQIYPPCGSHLEVLNIIEKADCWGSEVVYPDPLIGGDPYALLTPCPEDAGSCYTSYKICWVGSVLTKTLFGSYLNEAGDCDFYEPEHPWDQFYDCWSVCD